MRDEHAAARCGDDLVSVEREDAHRSTRANLNAAILRTQCFGGILEDGNVPVRTNAFEPIEVRALAIEMHDDDGSWQTVDLRSRLQSFGQHIGIDVPSRSFAVDEDGPRTLVDDRIRGRGEGECCAKDLVVVPNAEELEPEMKGCRSA